MFDRWLGFKIHHYLQALGLFILAFGLPMNKVLMSIGTIWLAANIIIKADFSTYWENWKKNMTFWFIFGVLCLYIIGLSYTSNFDYAFSNFKSLLPIFVVPISLIAFPIERKWFNYILYGFLLSLIITSGINFNFILHHPDADYRAYSLFGSHIRYALCIVMGIFSSIYLLSRHKNSGWLYIPIILWFSFYTYISKVDTGYVAFALFLFAFFLHLTLKIKKRRWKWSILFLFFAITLSLGIGLAIYLKPHKFVITKTTFPKKSEYGSIYYNDTTSRWFENGHHVLSCISDAELRKAWNKRASIKYRQLLDNGYTVKNILIRYMTSKGLTKDRVGMEQMSPQDIQNVIDGMPSIIYTYNPIHQRLALIKNQLFNYVNGADPNGYSTLERFEHWRAATYIIKNNFWWGVGTGDVQEAFNTTYKNYHFQLNQDNWERAHNEYLTFWVTFGVLGFLLFTGFWICFLWKGIKNNLLFGVGFTLLTMVSYLSEDTLETQKGVTFVALFLGLTILLYQWKKEEKKEATTSLSSEELKQ